MIFMGTRKKDDGTGNIKFTTRDNTDKFYFTNRGDAGLDYPSVFIGTMTPSIFRWTKMRHLYDIYDMAYADKENKLQVIRCGEDMYTAIEFLQSISESRSWTFDFGLSHK
jgi:hypothetical protein